jgi:hypothetical protein
MNGADALLLVISGVLFLYIGLALIKPEWF